MIPSALAGQLQQGLADFLRFSFWSSTPGMEHVVDDLLVEPGSLLKGPYVSIKLPFLAGENPCYFPDVPLGFTPHRHQEQAFERLGGRRKLSTLIATGTGSGKTESFLLPILDHCLSGAGSPGVKAILVYPMNALASDQAARIARLIHDNAKLRGRVTAGLYVGEDRGKKAGGETRMGKATVITDRATMQDAPPTVLLTNYKMLDYLLLRPDDQGIWQHNQRGTLRFLVVDEIHTFDGAQGTDLACLIRRIKRRLRVDDGSLCCVGTSATLGGEDATAELRDYASKVFGEPFDDASVIGESRLSEADYLEGCSRQWTSEPGPGDLAALDPARAKDPEPWLQGQVRLWLGELPADGKPAAGGSGDWAVELGDRLKHHAAFHQLLRALAGGTVSRRRLIARFARQRGEWRRCPELARLALTSLLALVSAARARRRELPAAAARREARGEPPPVQPFLEVRLQLWQRELRRMVASVGERPRLRHSMDLDRESRRRHLPLIHCRECGGMGWATLIQRDKPHLLRADLASFYRAFFSNDARVAFLFPGAAAPPEGPNWPYPPFSLDTESLTVAGDGEQADGPVVRLIRAKSDRSTARGPELSRDCPFCASRDSLTIVGFRAATLTSVYIDQLFASTFNDDKKLLTFSDSVQDAAHRAGFFGARTWQTNLRIAMHRVIREHDGLSLAALADSLGSWWRQRMDAATWVATFLAPNMAWLHDWDLLKASGELPADSNLEHLINHRLAYEVGGEFGLQAGIGRSLPRTGTATVALDGKRLERAVAALIEPLRNEVPGLREVGAGAVRHFVVGLLHRLRTRGGILARSLPDAYVETCGSDVHAFKRALALPVYGRTSRLPVLLTDRARTRFETWVGKSRTSWYARWVPTCLSPGQTLIADAASTYPLVLPALVAAGLLKERAGKRRERIWGLDEQGLRVTTRVAAVACERCGHRAHVAEDESEIWRAMPCLTQRCEGRYAVDPRPFWGYFGRLYAAGDLRRIFAEEHTGLLDRRERERVEQEFKASARRPWFANLLSCTPTLEMGIDVGDLSAAVLCSVPPAQANYLQRIGRAGRRDGNAFVLTVAGARPHDQYFFAEPAEMMAGEVAPPGVFLDAPAILERQLTAFCVDRWVAIRGDAARLPRLLRSVFSHLDDEGSGSFPFNLVEFVRQAQPKLLREFREMFAGRISADTEAHLKQFMVGTDAGKAGLRWNLLETLHRERKQRDSLSAQARALRVDIKCLRQAEARPQDYEDQLAKLDSEKEAMLALVATTNRRHTLEFLTGEGLLPNYAFPESAVRLSSVIWRKKKTAPSEGSRYQTWSYEYQRSPSSALSELAPHSDFYAGGRRVKIDQVDVAVSEVEPWRFCTECNHAQRIDSGDEASACPACGSAGWRDDGQKFRMLKLQQVFANAPDRESRIRDDRDDRQPRFFQRQILVDVQDQDRAGAWRLDDDRLPFGFELLERATFREVNFGESTDQGAKSVIAGREAARPGFELCGRCGKVQRPKRFAGGGDEPEHALSCPCRKEGARQQIESCLYLYRTFDSEALRMLLPMTDLGTSRQLNSFVAALQAGLGERFGGRVDHLRTTVYSDPVAGSTLRKQYLVIFDSVPGGTGYLKELLTPPTPGGEMPLFEAMEMALHRIEGCRCWNDPERDGCYRCLYAYRNARDMGDTSALVASKLLRRILAKRGGLRKIKSLGEVSISGLMDSVLEVRFLEALRLITDNQGRAAKLKPAVINQKTGYRWSLGEAEWVVELQVLPPVAESAGLPVSIDFVMRPASARSERKLAIFLDGWTFHKRRIGKDLRQRMALLAGGGWDVWTFTWGDLDDKLGVSSSLDQVPELAVPDPANLKDVLRRCGLAEHVGLVGQPVFRWFENEIKGPGLPWRNLAGAVLAARMRRVLPGDAERWGRFVDRVAPPAARGALAEMAPKLLSEDRGEINAFFELTAVHDGSEAALLCTLDDREEGYDAPEFKAAWQGYLRLFQLLRGAPGAWFMTRTGTAEGAEYQPLAAQLHGPGAPPGRQPPGGAAWRDAGEIEPGYRRLALRLMAAGVREPEIGMEIPDRRGDAWAEAELLWEEERVAVTARADTAGALGEASEGWTVLYLEDLGGDPAPVIEVLTGSE